MEQPGRPFVMVAKPAGAACNLDCDYCFFSSKDQLYPSGQQLMGREQLESFLRGYLAAQPDGPVTVMWQGGEPTLRGQEFFAEAVRLTSKLARPEQEVTHGIQTNGTLIDESWARFFAGHSFLVGLSLDGPAEYHNRYRVNHSGKGTHEQVLRGWRTLRRYGVETNILCTVHQGNAAHPLQVYRFFRDELEARYLQFIPIVERVAEADLPIAEAKWRKDTGQRLLYQQAGTAVTSRSVAPDTWGTFLTAIFDEWVHRDVGTMFVQLFDVMLGNLLGRYSLCAHAPQCGNALAVEFNGDIYPCDHYVEPDRILGNVSDYDGDLSPLMANPDLVDFGAAKLTDLPLECRNCSVRWACNGGCPKDRIGPPEEKTPRNYLCSGYHHFFTAAQPAMETMARLLEMGRPAADIIRLPRTPAARPGGQL